jgi:bifunctional non-homologous end joining protein LigD
MGLKEYRQKRELKKTPEPGPSPSQTKSGQYLVFVVHKHASRRLHYDLRLEMEGVLKSFAVPKGPSLDPSIKRLAVKVEDHPFDYKDFEGNIPNGNYGAGGVIIWDKGFYGSPFSKDKKEGEKLLLEGLKKGDLKFVLAGVKLKGEFALVKTRWDEQSWLLLKKKDRYASTDDILKQDRSVFSDKTIDDFIGESPTPKAMAVMPSPRETAGQNAVAATAQKSFLQIIADAPNKPMPHNIEPMLPVAIKKPFNHADWIYEVKWDGYRAIAELNDKSVLFYSRNRMPLMKKFPPVDESLQKLGLTAVLDGEIIVADDNGMPDFQKLQHYKGPASGHLIYYVFDILFYQGRDLTGLPLITRKEFLKELLPPDERIKYSEHVWKDGVSFFNAAKQKGLEGIVAKHSGSLYEPGSRNGQWLKIKNRITQDCVISGFTSPKGMRKYMGSLVLGAYSKGELIYIGHSGGGFGVENIKTMYEKLLPLARKTCPFKIKPPGNAPITWVKPTIVCEVAFTGWTKDKVMRQPVFLRLRDDKTPDQAELSF